MDQSEASAMQELQENNETLAALAQHTLSLIHNLALLQKMKEMIVVAFVVAILVVDVEVPTSYTYMSRSMFIVTTN